MDGPYDTGPRPWNPGLEAWPGGPHPGAIVAQIDEERDRIEAKKRKKRRHLLLLR